MGTGPFAVPSFQAILASHHSIVQVITRPAVATGKKNEAIISPVRQWATDAMLALADPHSINDVSTIEWLRELRADLMVVCDYGQILSRDALAATRLGGINLHGSLLPRHRGAAPVQWTILAGDANAGVSVIHMTPALDGGPVLVQASVAMLATEDAGQLEVRLSHLGVQATLDALSQLSEKGSWEDCSHLGLRQDKTQITKAPRLSKEDAELDCRYRAHHIDRLVRGLQPWPGSFGILMLSDGKSLRVLFRDIVPVASTVLAGCWEPGCLVFGDRLEQAKLDEPRLDPFALVIAVADGVIGIPSLQPAGKRMMQADEFLRGYARHSDMRLMPSRNEHPLLKTISQFP
jgi:methionyl-tRNA formyltransferase